MKIALIGSEGTVNHVLSLVDQKSLFIEFDVHTCLSEDAGKVVSSCQESVDGVLFTGNFPFTYANRDSVAQVPWEYIYRNPSAFISTIFRESLLTHREIKRISSDLWNESGNLLGQNLYSSLEILLDQLKIIRFTKNLLAKDVVDQIIEFHCRNYDRGLVDICLSSIERIYNQVAQRGYPIALVRPTMEIIFHQLEKLRLRHQLRMGNENHIAVISIQTAFHQEHSLDGRNDDYHQFLREHAQQDKIYIFARQIDGAVEIHENGLSYIYTIRSALENETRSFSNFPLIDRLASTTGVRSAAIGIGLGRTQREAKSNSDQARLMAISKNDSCFYITYEDRQTAGPFFVQNEKEEEESLKSNLQKLSSHTNLGMNTLETLQRVIRQYNLDVTTPFELARYCNMSVTNMNRIITKLEAGGYIKVIGSQPLAGAGRPRRLIKLYIDA